MRNPNYSSVDPNTGDVTFKGPLSLEKGDHSHMPHTTPVYLPNDERGHLCASGLGGVNSTINVVPQARDVNHGAFLSMENGERAALKSGASIYSEKTAVVNSQPGDRPSNFLITDSVTYSSGHTEIIHHSFTNESYATQEAWNDMSASLPGTFDAPNPGDGLRDSMDAESYAYLMEATDASLPSLSAEYAPADFSGEPSSADNISNASTDSDAESSDCSAEVSGTDAGDGFGGASADAE